MPWVGCWHASISECLTFYVVVKPMCQMRETCSLMSKSLAQVRARKASRTCDSFNIQNSQLRCAVDSETRVADCKALLSHGSSLGPFWLHIQAQLKRLEYVLSMEEAAISYGAEQYRLLSTPFSSIRNQAAPKTILKESNREENDNNLTSVEVECHADSQMSEENIAFPTGKDQMSSMYKEHTLHSQVEHLPSPEHGISNESPNRVHTHSNTNHDLEDGGEMIYCIERA